MPSPQQMYTELLNSMTQIEDERPYFKGMFYGESGVGKTILAIRIAQALCPPGKFVLYFDSKEGWTSVLNHPELKQGLRRIKFQAMSQIEALAQILEAGVGEFQNVGAVVIDEYSTLSDYDLDQVLAVRSRVDKTKDPDVATQPDFNANTQRMRRLTDALFRIPEMHLIFLAHIRYDKDNRGVTVASPSFMPKLSAKLRESMHLVGRMQGEDMNNPDGTTRYIHQVQVHPTKLVIAKSRIGGLPVNVSDDTLVQAVAEWVHGGRDTVNSSTIHRDTPPDFPPTDSLMIED